MRIVARIPKRTEMDKNRYFFLKLFFGCNSVRVMCVSSNDDGVLLVGWNPDQYCFRFHFSRSHVCRFQPARPWRTPAPWLFSLSVGCCSGAWRSRRRSSPGRPVTHGGGVTCDMCDMCAGYSWRRCDMCDMCASYSRRRWSLHMCDVCTRFSMWSWKCEMCYIGDVTHVTWHVTTCDKEDVTRWHLWNIPVYQLL